MPRPAADEAQDPIYLSPSVPEPAFVAPTPEPVHSAEPAASEAEPAARQVVALPAEAPEPTAPAELLRPKHRKQQVFVQVSSRVTVETRDLLDEIEAREGVSMRVALEHAIKSYHDSLP